MVGMDELTFAEKVLVANYGRCAECDAPCGVVSEQRGNFIHSDIGCTVDPRHYGRRLGGAALKSERD